MKINNKFEIGQKVVYPGADMGNPTLIESIIVGVSLWVDEGVETITYRTEFSYGVAEKHLAKTKNGAKKKLLQMMREKEKEIKAQITKAIETIEKTKASDLIQKLPNEETNALSEI